MKDGNNGLISFMIGFKYAVTMPEFRIQLLLLLSCSMYYIWWLVRRTLLMELGLLRDFFGNFSCKVKDIIFDWRGSCKVDARWECPHEVTLCGEGDNSTYTPPKSPHVHLAYAVHFMLTSCPPRINLMSTSHPCKVTLCGGGGNDDVHAANEEDLQKVFLTYSFKVISHGHVVYSSHLASTSCPHEETTSHKTPQSQLAPKEGTHEVSFIFWIDVTLMMSKLQIIKTCRNFSLYTVSKSPYIHLTCTSHPPCVHMRWLCVVEGTTRHTHPKSHLAWMRDKFHISNRCYFDDV